MILGKDKSDISIADDLYNKANNEIQRILSAMSHQNETGNPDKQVLDALQCGFAFNQEQAAQFAAERSAGWDSYNRGNSAFVRHLLSRIRDIAPEQMKLMVEIRRDLALLGDLSEVEAEMKKQLLRMEEKVNQFLQSVDIRNA